MSLLRLYCCMRWGNAQSAEGADGEDTTFIVRAESHEQAASLADCILRMMPTQFEGLPRSVEPWCHLILDLGPDGSFAKEPKVLLGPMIGYALHSGSEAYPSWMRGELPNDFEWIDADELYERGSSQTKRRL